MILGEMPLSPKSLPSHTNLASGVFTENPPDGWVQEKTSANTKHTAWKGTAGSQTMERGIKGNWTRRQTLLETDKTGHGNMTHVKLSGNTHTQNNQKNPSQQ